MQRNLVLVGHDVPSDINYLRKLGCTVFNPSKGSSPTDHKNASDQPCFLESIDTSNLFRVLKRDTQASSLAKVLIDLGITGWHLHNAGNDARYTLEAMVGIALKARLETDRPADATPNTTSESRAATATRVELHLADDAGKPAAGSQSSQGEKKKQDPAWQAEIERRVANSQKETEARIREECGLWDAVLGQKEDWDIPNDDIDGGIPSGLVVDN